jgi:hypothetical protein
MPYRFVNGLRKICYDVVDLRNHPVIIYMNDIL